MLVPEALEALDFIEDGSQRGPAVHEATEHAPSVLSGKRGLGLVCWTEDGTVGADGHHRSGHIVYESVLGWWDAFWRSHLGGR
eukprot:401087-Rhodomonas_salina.3